MPMGGTMDFWINFSLTAPDSSRRFTNFMLITSALALLLLAAQTAAPQTPPVPAAPAQAPTPEAKPTPDGAVIAIETTMGTIQVGLYATKAPLSSRNVLNYVKSGHYNGTTFHRVIPGFMIQGGGMDAKLVEKPTGPPVRNEARNGLLNSRGSLALARTDDPQSATSQFFISVKDNPMLDFGVSRDGWGYAVFGEVLSGMDVVDNIVAVPTTRVAPFDNVPVKPVIITRVRVISEPAAIAPPPKSAPRPATGTPRTAPKAAPRASPAAASPAKPKTTPTPAAH
jgi:cyclophilin family peptidyl-prolyl cis-trans isomerase